jgi:hypothetical protein
VSRTSDQQPGDWYEIRVQGRLDDRWVAWLDGLELSPTEDGTTVLRGQVRDQAALHGLLHKLRDLNLPLLSVAQIDQDRTATRPNPGSTTHLRRTR